MSGNNVLLCLASGAWRPSERVEEEGGGSTEGRTPPPRTPRAAQPLSLLRSFRGVYREAKARPAASSRAVDGERASASYHGSIPSFLPSLLVTRGHLAPDDVRGGNEGKVSLLCSQDVIRRFLIAAIPDTPQVYHVYAASCFSAVSRPPRSSTWNKSREPRLCSPFFGGLSLPFVRRAHRKRE